MGLLELMGRGVSIKIINNFNAKSIGSQRGFTYVLLLFFISISGIGLAALGDAWVLKSSRARESEFVWRGRQFQTAIHSYVRSSPIGRRSWPMSLEDLIEDRRSGRLVRHIRELYPDPISVTGVWVLIRHADGTIHGVYSSSKERPISGLLGASRYSDIRFEAFE